jgi:hypothetical protein
MYSRLSHSHSKLCSYEMSNTMKISFKRMVSKDLGEIVLNLHLWRVMEKFREAIYGFQLRNSTPCKHIIQPTIALSVALYHIIVPVLWTHGVISGRDIYQTFFYRRGQNSIPYDICGWLKALAQLLLINYHLNKAAYSHSAVLDTIQSNEPTARLKKPQENLQE